jgi:hypothetical protein
MAQQEYTLTMGLAEKSIHDHPTIKKIRNKRHRKRIIKKLKKMGVRTFLVPEIARALSQKGKSPFGYTHPERDKREMCRYCYNEDTRRMVGLELALYEDYYAGKPFKAFECECCRAKFHFSTQ